jgi:Fur family ferric uptake transcriptional regulator
MDELLTMEQGRALLQAANTRVTAPRIAVLQVLARSPRPLAHGEVMAALAAQPWDQATLYRNLLKLVEVGLARVATDAGGLIRYELAAGDAAHTHVHPHFVCRDCGKVQCLPALDVALHDDAARWRDAIADAEVQIVGRCPDCRA